MSAALTSVVPFADPLWHSYGSSHPNYNASHIKLQRTIREYVDANIIPLAGDWEETGDIPEENFQKHAKAGFLAAACYPIPAEYLEGTKLPAGIKPEDWDEFHDAIIIDEMARCGYLGVIWGINGGATVGGPPLANFATHEQKRKWLGPLLRGEQRHALAVTEPGVGSDVAQLATTAKKTPDGKHYIVNGAKKWITQGRWAHWALTGVRTGGPGHGGISILMIDLTSEGIERTKMKNSGVNSSGSTFIEFDDVKVPVENLIGQEGEGFKIIMSTFTHERLWVGITANRLARVALEDSYQYAQQRKTFGKSLLENQIIRSKFTLMAGLIESTSALAENLVKMAPVVPQLEFSPWAALLKYRAAHNLETVSREAQQVLGGAGYSRGGRGSRVEQISRDVRVLVVSGGSEEILMDMVIKQKGRQARL